MQAPLLYKILNKKPKYVNTGLSPFIRGFRRRSEKLQMEIKVKLKLKQVSKSKKEKKSKQQNIKEIPFTFDQALKSICSLLYFYR
jgi:hypothetical protein